MSTKLCGSGDWEKWNEELHDLLGSMGLWNVVIG